MKKIFFLGGLAAIAFALAAAAPASAADRWIGTWKLNLEKSTYQPGPAPKSQTLKFEEKGGNIKLTVNGVEADGKSMQTGYTSKFDGKEVAFKGNPNADMASPQRIDDGHYRNVWKKGGKETITSDVMVTKDGKQLTVSQTGKDAKGREVKSVEVYDRQ